MLHSYLLYYASTLQGTFLLLLSNEGQVEPLWLGWVKEIKLHIPVLLLETVKLVQIHN